MLSRVLKPFVYLLVVMALVSLACLGSGGATEPEPPVEQPEQPPAPVEQPPQQDPPESKDSYVVFVDRNDLFYIEVPSDWTQSEETDEDYYIDQFISPDGNALIESIVYDDGEPFTGNSKGKFALALLHQFYSYTGEEGDIRISDDKIMPDDSERLTWNSREGNYSGMSFFEVRDKTTFLMFTVEWADDFESDYIDILNHAIETYEIP